MGRVSSVDARDTGVVSKYAFSLGRIQAATDIYARLESRRRCTVAEFSKALEIRAAKYGQAPMSPDGPADAESLFPKTYYLTGVNERHHRTYERF